MLRSASKLTSYAIMATDATLGQVKDVLFDDRSWGVRYLVADSGKWLPGRRVLIPPEKLEQPDWERKVLPVALTREQVKRSPGIREDEPVSQRREAELRRHYGVTLPAAKADPYAAATAVATAEPFEPPPPDEGDPHLRSMNEVVGYYIAARDGDIGHVEDLIVDDEAWLFRYVVVDTKNWWPGKKVIVSPQWIERIDWADRKVAIDLERDRIRNSPEYDPTEPVNREYEARLYDYYGRPHYWK